MATKPPKRKQEGSGDDDKDDKRSAKNRPEARDRDSLAGTTRDIAVARGYLVENLDLEGKVIADLFNEFLTTAPTDLLFFGERLQIELAELLKNNTGHTLYFDVTLCIFALADSAAGHQWMLVAPRKKIETVLAAIAEKEGGTKKSTKKPKKKKSPAPPNQRQSGDNDDSEQTEVEESYENPFDLETARLAYITGGKKASDAVGIARLIQRFLSEMQVVLPNRVSITIRDVSLWQLIDNAVQEIFNRVKRVVYNVEKEVFEREFPYFFVVFDVETGNLRVETQDNNSDFLVFSTKDLLHVFSYRAFYPVHFVPFYAKLLNGIEEMRGNNKNATSITDFDVTYALKPLRKFIESNFHIKEIQKQLLVTTVLFNPAGCSFAALDMKPSVDPRKLSSYVAQLDKRLELSGEKVLFSTYAYVMERMNFTPQASPNIDNPSMTEAERDEMQIVTGALGGDQRQQVESPLDPKARSFWRGTSPNQKKLNDLWRKHCLFVGYPQTVAGELIWLGILLYREFCLRGQSFAQTLERFDILQQAYGHTACQTLRLLLFYRHNLTPDALTAESFMQDIVTLAALPRYVVKIAPMPAHQRPNRLYMFSAGRFQGVLENLRDTLEIVPFGDLKKQDAEAIRAAAYFYQYACYATSYAKVPTEIDIRSLEAAEKSNKVRNHWSYEWTVYNLAVVLFDADNADAILDKFLSVRMREYVSDKKPDISKSTVDLRLVDDVVAATTFPLPTGLYFKGEKLEKKLENIRIADPNTAIWITRESRELRGQNTQGLSSEELRERLISRVAGDVVLFSNPSVRRIRTILAPQVLIELSEPAEPGAMALDDDDFPEFSEEKQPRFPPPPQDVKAFDGFQEPDTQSLVRDYLRNILAIGLANSVWREAFRFAVQIYRQARNPNGYYQGTFDLWRRLLGKQNVLANNASSVLMRQIGKVMQDRFYAISDASNDLLLSRNQFLREIWHEARDTFDSDYLELDEGYKANLRASQHTYLLDEGPLGDVLEDLFTRLYTVVTPVGSQDARKIAFTNRIDRYNDVYITNAVGAVDTDAKISHDIVVEFAKDGVDLVKLFGENAPSPAKEYSDVARYVLKNNMRDVLFFYNNDFVDLAKTAVELVAEPKRKNVVFYLFKFVLHDPNYALISVPNDAAPGYLAKFVDSDGKKGSRTAPFNNSQSETFIEFLRL